MGLFFMYCLMPLYLPGIGVLPCGRCRYCRIMRSNQWAMRMMHEWDYWEKAVFITLTYNNENLPEGGILVKDDLQRFFKRIRKAIMPGKIRYFACGEYGDTYDRPHYHAIIFGIGIGDGDMIREKWGKGFIKVGRVDMKSCKYVSKYIIKAPLGVRKREWYEMGKTPAFQACSHYIGMRWIEANAETVGRVGMSYHGRKIGMPRYYVDKIRRAGLPNLVIEESKADAMLSLREYYENLEAQGLTNGDALARHREDLRLQRVEEVKTKDGMYKGLDSQ
jgi:hypothetical protein